jgi:ADP-ribose pyrophosphatase
MNQTGNRTPDQGPAVTRTTLYRGAKFDFERVEYPGQGGKMLERQVIRHPGAVVILPILQEQGNETRVVLIRNNRIPAGTNLLELPAGTREPGEPPELTAGRELIEETGYRAKSLTLLGSYYTSPGLSDEQMWAYVATGLEATTQDLEDDERITVEVLGTSKLAGIIDRGELQDAKSMLTILWAVRKGLLDGV